MNSSTPKGLTIVSGAASGIGKSLVHALVQSSKQVLALDKDTHALKELARDYPKDKLSLRAVDLCDLESLGQQLAPFLRGQAPIDGLAQCAGVWLGGTTLETQREQWQHLLDNNLMSTRNICSLVAPTLIQQQRGAIAIVSSNAARMPRLDMSAYCVSKAALTMYAKCLALELAPHQVRCNIVSPGATQTPMQSAYQKYMEQSVIDHRFRIPAPLPGQSQAKDIANILSFLLSERSGSMTMSDISADRGATLGV